MKHKKILRRKTLLLLIGLITLWNCQSDDSYNSESIQNNKNYKITKLSFSDLERMNGVLDKIQEAELKSKKESTQFRTTEIRGFRVNTDNVLMVEKDGIHSLNFEIIEEENEKHRNLVLNQENDDSYSVYIVEYDLTPEEKEILRTGEQVNINGKASLVIEDEEGEKIIAVSELVEDNDSGIDLQSSVFNNSTLVARGRKRCDECEGEYQGGGGTPIIITRVSSFEFLHMDWGWGPATPIDLGITLPGDSGGGGNPVTVTPVVSPANSYFNEFFFFYLFDKPDLQNWVNDPQNSEVKQQIEDYINQPFSYIIGGPSQQEQINQRFEFAEWVIEFFINDPNTTWEQIENYFSINDNINYDLFNELKLLSTSDFNEFIEINNDLENFNSIIQANSFDLLNSPWMKQAREYAVALEEWSNNLGPKAKEKANELIDKTFIYALKKTAQQIYPSVGWLNESQKQTQFQTNGNNAVGILLYEFATGTGQDERIFPLNSDIAQKLVAGDRLTAIKNNFFVELAEENLTFEQFVANGEDIYGGYAFSPDHTTIEESINAHINANLVQFFIGGTSNKYSPTNQSGWIKVTISNETSRNSLLLHQGSNYPRTGNGNNKPLSTIKQEFTFLLKVD